MTWMRCLDKVCMAGLLLALSESGYGQEPEGGGIYRRFIEAEDMTIEGAGFKAVSNQAASGGLAVDIIKPGEGRLVKTLERMAPAGEYVLWARMARLPRASGAKKKGGRPAKSKPAFDLGDAPGAEQATTLNVSAGQAEARLTIAASNTSGCGWTVFKAAAPFQTLAIACSTAAPGLMADRFYLSGRPADVLPGAGLIDVNRIWRDKVKEQPEVFPGFPAWAPDTESGNLIANGSFEVGIGSYEWSTMYQCMYALIPEYLDEREAFEGEKSLGFQMFPVTSRFKGDPPTQATQLQLLHKVIKLPPNRRFYFRGMFKSDAEAKVSVSAEAAYDNSEKPTELGRSREVALSNQWRAVEMEIKPNADPRGCYLRIKASAPGRARLWMDALTLTAERTTSFTAAAPVEIGVHWTAPGKIFYADEPANFILLAHCYPPAQSGKGSAATGGGDVTAHYRVLDFFEQVVADETLTNWPVAAGQTQTRALDLNRGRTGAFRLLLDGWAQIVGQSIKLPLQEYVFSILPRPPAKMQHSFGAYTTVQKEPILIMSRAGIRKTVTLSSENELFNSWAYMEPSPGKFVWADERVGFAVSNDVVIVANLDIGSRLGGIPKWAFVAAPPGQATSKSKLKKQKEPKVAPQAMVAEPDDPDEPAAFKQPGARPAAAADDVVLSASGQRVQEFGYFSGKAWADFTEHIARHYRGAIDDWLIMDEPYHAQKPAEYAAMMALTYPAMKRGNPDCRIWAHGGYYPAWLQAMETLGVVSNCDAISDYARNPAQAARLKAVAEKHHKPYVNVEYGWHVSMYRTIESPQLCESRLAPGYQGNAANVVAGALMNMAWSGASGFNRYDARYPGGDFKQLEWKSLFEYDGALKPAGTAFAVVAQLLDGFHGVRQLDEITNNLAAFLLQDSSRFAIAFRLTNGIPGEAELNLPGQVRAFDIMGNRLPAAPEPALIGSKAFHYLIGPQSQFESTLAMLKDLAPRPIVSMESSLQMDERRGRLVATIVIRNLSARLALRGVLISAPHLANDFYGLYQPVEKLAPLQSLAVPMELAIFKNQPRPDSGVPVAFYISGPSLADRVVLDALGKKAE